MTQKHTPEPWPHFIEWCEPATPHPDSDGFVGLGFEDYQRARACVNACRGLPTDELEQSGLAGAFGNQMLELEQQRDHIQALADELLEAAYHMISNIVVVKFSGEWSNAFVDGEDLTEYCQPLQDAIKKITGETK